MHPSQAVEQNASTSEHFSPDEWDTLGVDSENIHFSQKAKHQQEELPPSPEKISDAFLSARGRDFSIFAKDSTLRFAPDKTADTFAFYPKENKVCVPLSWFENEKYTKRELTFANYHELAHFIDMRENPKAYLENFARMKEKSASLADAYLKKAGKNIPHQAVMKFYYDKLHNLYNCLDDIYVNKLVKQKSPLFATGDGKEDVVHLYEKVGFGDPDLTKLPKHDQMIYSLLRDEMVGDTLGKSQVSPEVESALSKKIMGQSIRQIVSENLRPRSSKANSKGLTNPEDRYSDIRRYIERVYLDLLEQDLEEQEKQEEQRNQDANGSEGSEGQESQNTDNSNDSESQEGQGEQTGQKEEQQNNSSQDDGKNTSGKAQSEDGSQKNSKTSTSQDFDPFGDAKEARGSFLDTADEETIKQILDQFEEQDRIDKMSPSERKQYQQEKRDEARGITKMDRKTFELSASKIRKPRRKMLKFWTSLIGKSEEYRTTIESYQKKGRFNARSYINRYAQTESDLRSGITQPPEIYDRTRLEKVLVEKPEEIDITLLVDGSGSMSSDKIQSARETAALLMLSIKDFNEELNKKRRENKSKLRANTEVIMFGSDFEHIKHFEKTSDYNKNDAEIVKSISAINNGYGSTDDARPLRSIRGSITPEQRDKIKSGKLLKIIFEITDGQPDDDSATHSVVKSLSADGVLIFGFQIGNVRKQEKKTFNDIWNGDGQKRGIVIGENIEQLPEELIKTLAASMEGVRI